MRQGKSVDVFSFGLVLFYCLTGGKHAFGESYERDFNIMQVWSFAAMKRPLLLQATHLRSFKYQHPS